MNRSIDIFFPNCMPSHLSCIVAVKTLPCFREAFIIQNKPLKFMKTTFSEFYKYSEDEIVNIWDNCIFVFDTNVLLDLYRYSKKTSDEFLKILEIIHTKEQVWMPHQVGLEFNERRIQIISDLDKSYDAIKGIIIDGFRGVQNEIDKKYHKEHPFINLEEIGLKINKCVEDVSEMITKCKENHPDWFNEDEILKTLTRIFEKNVGKEYTNDKKSEIFIEGKTRYLNKIPPGYEDSQKGEERQFGDLIMWFQIIDKATESKKPIVFVTRDKKEDWWWKQSGKTIGPRYELKREIREKANAQFCMYSSEKFLEYASKYFKETVNPASITEVGRISTMLEERNYMVHDSMKLQNIDDYGKQLSSNLDELFGEIQILVKLKKDVNDTINEYYVRLTKLTDCILSKHDGNLKMIEDLVMIQKAFQRNIIMFYEAGIIEMEQFIRLTRFLRDSIESCFRIVEYTGNNHLLEMYLSMTRQMINRLERILMGILEDNSLYPK